MDDNPNAAQTALLWTSGYRGWVCFNQRGTITISELTRDVDGTPTSLAVTYSTTCDDPGLVGNAVVGNVLWNSTAPYVALAAPVRMDFNRVPIGPASAPITERVTNAGTSTVTLGTAVLGGPSAAAFKILTDGCKGRSLQPQAFCDVLVDVTVSSTSEINATLTITDSTPQGKRLVQLAAAGMYAPSSVVATPGPGEITVGFVLQDLSGQEFQDYDSVVSFTILRGTSAADLAVVGGASVDSETYQDTTVTTGQPYVYQVRAITWSGSYAASALTGPAVAWPEFGSGRFLPLSPYRILDTRTGVGAAKHSVGAGAAVVLAIAGHGPNSSLAASAVVLNVIAVAPTADTYLTVYPAGSARPLVSDLNLRRGEIRANLVTVPLGAGGAVDIYNRAGSVNIVADEVGYYSASAFGADSGAGQFHPVTPTRVIDTRSAGQQVLASHHSLLTALRLSGVPSNSRVQAVALNVTVVAPSAGGYVTAWSGGGPIPLASTVNFAPRETVPNLSIVPVEYCTLTAACAGEWVFGIYNGSSGPLHLVVDVVGFYDDNTIPGGMRFHPLSPRRVVDSRIGQGLVTALGPAGQASVALPAADVDPLTAAVLMNVTAVVPSASTAVTVWPAGVPRPLASNLNVPAGRTAANAVITGIDGLASFNMYNSAGTTNLIADLQGTFEAWAAAPAAIGPRASVDLPVVRSTFSTIRAPALTY